MADSPCQQVRRRSSVANSLRKAVLEVVGPLASSRNDDNPARPLVRRVASACGLRVQRRSQPRRGAGRNAAGAWPPRFAPRSGGGQLRRGPIRCGGCRTASRSLPLQRCGPSARASSKTLRLPFAAVAVAVRTGHAVVLDHGSLVAALLSSGALPGAWPPVMHDGETLVDGGLVVNVPLVQAVSLGAASLVVLDAGWIPLRASMLTGMIPTLRKHPPVHGVPHATATRRVPCPPPIEGSGVNEALHQLHEADQSIWYDNIRRALLDSGRLQEYVAEFSVTGVTSNPTIFEQAIAGGSDYDKGLREATRARRASTTRLVLPNKGSRVCCTSTTPTPLRRSNSSASPFKSPNLPDRSAL